MKIAVLGSGVIGVTSAWYLAKAGHEVTVIDRETGPGQVTSFANAGEISPGYAAPWAAPGIPRKAIRWMMMSHPPLIIRPRLDPEMLRWLSAMLRNCTGERYAVNKSRMVRLAEYSRDELIALRAATGIAYDERMQGTLEVFRSQKQFDDLGKDIEVLRAGGVPFEVLDRDECAVVEPGLAATRDKIVGGLRLPNDETGDCFKFTNALAAMAQAKGVTFRYGTEVESLAADAGRIVSVQTSKGTIVADRYVVAMGTRSPQAVRPLGLRLPVYPVKGYSITAPIVDVERSPASTVVDESYKVAFTRLGDRIRVGGTAEIAGHDLRLRPERRATLVHLLQDLFPGAGDVEAASFWTGLRPMTPDGTPVIGRTSIPNLFLNTGHGTLGWTMACGSGALLADLIGGTEPAIDASDLSIARYDQN